jgi:hypothetical protein
MNIDHNREKSRQRNKRWYKKNHTRILQQRAIYRENNGEKIREQQADYRKNNQTHIKQLNAAYYQENKESIRCNHTAYYQKNRDKILQQDKRKVVFKGKQIMMDFNPRKGICRKCGKKVDIEIKNTNLHHKKYHEEDILRDTIELCVNCHNKRHKIDFWQICKKCNSNDVVRASYYRNGQRFLCNNCKIMWTVPIDELAYHLLNFGLQKALDELERKGRLNWLELVRKSDGPEQIGLIIKTMAKYAVDERENDC